ncbi:unnamed protein product [Owenia fusiformis]|uniref:Uncharacterized protein n=1 Tax=Owenia fusiformis TaxID=6347 RepID=A0A8J1TUG5_OWEFU|nr:unnamed protein product [Owenia fusiformis]
MMSKSNILIQFFFLVLVARSNAQELNVKETDVECTSKGVKIDISKQFEEAKNEELYVKGSFQKTKGCFSNETGILDITFPDCGTKLGSTFQIEVTEVDNIDLITVDGTKTSIFNISCAAPEANKDGGIVKNVTTEIAKVDGSVNATKVDKVDVKLGEPNATMIITREGENVNDQDVTINTELSLEITVTDPSDFNVFPETCYAINGAKSVSLLTKGCPNIPNVFPGFKNDANKVIAKFKAFRVRNSETTGDSSNGVTFFCSVRICGKSDGSDQCKLATCTGKARLRRSSSYNSGDSSQEDLLTFIRVVDPNQESKNVGNVCMQQTNFIVLVVVLALLFLVTFTISLVLACKTRKTQHQLVKLRNFERPMEGIENRGLH